MLSYSYTVLLTVCVSLVCDVRAEPNQCSHCLFTHVLSIKRAKHLSQSIGAHISCHNSVHSTADRDIARLPTAAMTDPNELVDLRTKYDKLAAELSFERQMNNILENIRNYCLLMLNECQCPMSTIGDNMQVFHKLNRQFIQLKVKQLIDNSDDCDHRECCKTRDNTLDINDFVDTEPENTVPTDVVPEDDEPVPDGDQLIMLEISEEVEVDSNQIAEQMNQQDEHDTDTDIDTDTVHSPPEPTTSVTLAEPEAHTTPQSSRSPAKTPERVKRAYKKSSYNLSSNLSSLKSFNYQRC